MTKELKVLREYRPFPKGPLVRIVSLPEEPLFTPDQLANLRRRANERLRDEADRCILAERKLARGWAGAAGADKWEWQRYKRTGYEKKPTPDNRSGQPLEHGGRRVAFGGAPNLAGEVLPKYSQVIQDVNGRLGP